MNLQKSILDIKFTDILNKIYLIFLDLREIFFNLAV